MPKTVSTADATDRLPELLDYRDRQNRMADLAALRSLRERVRAQNQDLTDDDAQEWADRFVAESSRAWSRREPSASP